jgi:hypothetical protein
MSDPVDSDKAPGYAAFWPYVLRAARYLRPYKRLAYESAALVLASTLLSLLAP